MVGYDVAQICENGHIVNGASLYYKERNEKHCSKCGAHTITACPACSSSMGNSGDTIKDS